MIVLSDSNYQETKDILLGNKHIHPDFAPIADFIGRKFGVTPINIIYNKQGDNTRTVLMVCVEYQAQVELFNQSQKRSCLNRHNN